MYGALRLNSKSFKEESHTTTTEKQSVERISRLLKPEKQTFTHSLGGHKPTLSKYYISIYLALRSPI